MSKYGDLSRETELEAIEIIQSYIQTDGEVIDTGDTKGYDFEIFYTDGRTAIGEIGILEDEQYRASWNSLIKHPTQHVVPLPAGYGVWSARLHKSANGKHFRSNIRGLVEKLLVTGTENLVIQGNWPQTSESEIARELGIQHLRKVQYLDGDFVFYTIEHSAEIFIPDSLEPLVEQVQRLLLESSNRDSWQKLMPYDSLEKHVYVKCGSLISYNFQEHLLLERDPLPIPDIVFPDGVTHIWLKSTFVESRTLLWKRDGQKIHFP